MLKIALVLFEIYVLVGKKGYKRISVPGSCKTICFCNSMIKHVNGYNMSKKLKNCICKKFFWV